MLRPLDPPRYLASFDPRRISHRFTDVLVLGSGLAGLRAALAVSPDLQAVMVTKESVRQSNSHYAQGGIAAVWTPEDCFASHVEDTLAAGKGLCDRAIVDLVVHEAPQRVQELIDWGTIFDQQNGQIDLTREGGHTFRRILHALGDATGKEVIRAVHERAAQAPNLSILEGVFTIDLLTHDGSCRGALVWSESVGVQAIWSKQTVLATGGCGQLFRETTNPPVATGDGLAMAYRAGATLQDMEFMQFHPTVLYVAGSARHLISEAVRGEGAYLVNNLGERFMPRYAPQAELAPRDTVAKAIVAEMNRTQHPCVYLDQSHLDPDAVRTRFPGIVATCAKYGLDFATDRIPVRPGAHFMVGGVSADAAGMTSIAGLWACGEVAANGLHGANRLASNSLLEALVFGQRCGIGASAAARAMPTSWSVPPVANTVQSPLSEPLDLTDIRNSLQSVMFRNVGVERTRPGLDEAAHSVDFWGQYVLRHEFADPAGWELQNMLIISRLIIAAALERTESRGTHNRSDFPAVDDVNWRRHLTCSRLTK